MKTKTLNKMARDTTLSVMQRTMAGYLNETRKRNGHRNIDAAAHRLSSNLGISLDEAMEYGKMVSSEADDLERFAAS